jgi:hypothetical protein
MELMTCNVVLTKELKPSSPSWLVELRNGRNHPGSISRWSELWVDFLKNPLAGEPEFGGF